MRCLQIGVEFIKRVLQTIAIKRHRRLAKLGRQLHAANAAFGVNAELVGVIAQKNHEIQIFARHVAVSRIKPVAPILTRSYRKSQFVNSRARRRSGARAPNRTGMIAHDKTIKVESRGPQTFDFDVNRVR